jgi:hypothetical protein
MIVYQHIADGQTFRRYAWEWERDENTFRD